MNECAHATAWVVFYSARTFLDGRGYRIGMFPRCLLLYKPLSEGAGQPNFLLMTKRTKWILGIIAFLLMTGWAYYNNGYQHDKVQKHGKKEYPVNPDIQTEYGQLGDCKTVDEFYMDGTRKVYHGYRKNLYSSGSPKIASYYEHGKLIWTEEYDQAGNVTSSNK